MKLFKTIVIGLALAGVNMAHAADVAMPANLIAKVRTMPGVSQLGCNEFTMSEYAEYTAINPAGVRLSVVSIIRARQALSASMAASRSLPTIKMACFRTRPASALLGS